MSNLLELWELTYFFPNTVIIRKKGAPWRQIWGMGCRMANEWSRISWCFKLLGTFLLLGCPVAERDDSVRILRAERQEVWDQEEYLQYKLNSFTSPNVVSSGIFLGKGSLRLPLTLPQPCQSQVLLLKLTFPWMIFIGTAGIISRVGLGHAGTVIMYILQNSSHCGSVQCMIAFSPVNFHA